MGVPHQVVLLQEGRPLPGPETGLEHSEVNCLRRHMSDKARDFIGQGHPHGEQQGKGTQNSSAVAHSDFMVMGGVFGLSLASNSD